MALATLKGVITDEVCNNHDDNCNGEIDENLTKMCYTGPQDNECWSLYAGQWFVKQVLMELTMSNQMESKFLYQIIAKARVLPALEDECNGEDDNCDGVIDDGKELVDTDILFIIDSSGSMGDEIDAVMIALNQFAESYKDEEVIQWGLLMGPFRNEFMAPAAQYNILISNLVPFSDFIASFSSIPQIGWSNKEAMQTYCICLSII